MDIKSFRTRITISIIFAIIIPILVGLHFLLKKNEYDLIALFLYNISANSFIPFPHEPVIIYYGKLFSPLTISILCGLATCISALIDIFVLGTFLNHERVLDFKANNKIYKIVEHYFNQTPFLTMAFAAFLPVPFYPFRVLGIASGYSKWKYVLSIFMGRVPRYYVLAWVGNNFFIETRYLIFLFFILIIPPIIKIAYSKFFSKASKKMWIRW